MKTKLFLICIVAILISSCAKKGPSDETKSEVNKLDSSWNAMGMDAMAMDADMKKMLDDCVARCSGMEGKMSEMKADMKMKCDSLMTCCKKDREELTNLQTAWKAEVPKWEQYTEELKEFKAQVDNSKVTDEEAQAKLKEFQKRLEEGQAGMNEWKTKYSTCKEMCMKNMNACAEMEAKTEAGK